MRKRVWMVLLGVVPLVLATAPVGVAATGGTDRPFTATMAGEARWEFPGESASGCKTVTTFTDASGTATHLGAVQASWSHCPDEPGYDQDGRLRIVAANGDELYGVYDYPGIDMGSPITVTGGTGRFAEAAGALYVTYEVVPQFFCEPSDWDDEDAVWACIDVNVPWPWYGTLSGTIDY
jgi:hypothetical protein